jgi:hypothetical protein
VISAGALVVLTVLLGGIAGPVLARSTWPRRLPGAAVAAWLAALAGTLAALTGLVAMALLGRPGLGHHLVEWLLNCLKHHKHPSSSAVYVMSVLPLIPTVAIAAVALRRYRQTMAQRRRHRDALGIVVRPSPDFSDVCLIDHPVPVVYCLPDNEHQIVMSKGAHDRLNSAQLHAVLSHERAHLGQRHHLILALVDAAGAALGWLPSFRTARHHLPTLLEMMADDDAAWHTEPPIVAAALRKLAILPCPVGGLAAGPTDESVLTQRLARLDADLTPHFAHAHALNRAAILLWVIAPVLVCASWAAAIPLFC